MSLSKVIKDTVLNSSIAFVVSDVRPLSAVEGDGLIQFANAMIKVGATHGIVDAKAILPSRFTKKSIVGSVVKWLKHRTDDQHGLGSKPTCAILLCPWERRFTALSPAWWS